MHCKMHASCLPRKTTTVARKSPCTLTLHATKRRKMMTVTRKSHYAQKGLAHAWPCLAHGWCMPGACLAHAWPEPGQPKRPIRMFCDTSHTECSISACDSHLANAKYAHPTMICPPGLPPSTALPPDPHRRTKRILQAEPSRKKLANRWRHSKKSVLVCLGLVLAKHKIFQISP